MYFIYTDLHKFIYFILGKYLAITLLIGQNVLNTKKKYSIIL